VSVLQLDEVSLYAAGLALIEQNLHMLDSMNLFESQARQFSVKVQTRLHMTDVASVYRGCQRQDGLVLGI